MKYDSWKEKGMDSTSFFTIGLTTFDPDTCLETITALYCNDVDKFRKIDRTAFQMLEKLRLVKILEDRRDNLSNIIRKEAISYIEQIRKELKDYE